MKKTLFAAALSLSMLAAPLAQADPQDQAMATGAVVGATTGAVIGSGSNQAVQGAMVGAVFGTIAGAILASNYDEPVYVAPRHVHEREYRERHFVRDHRAQYYARDHRPQVRHVAVQRHDQRRFEQRRFNRD